MNERRRSREVLDCYAARSLARCLFSLLRAVHLREDNLNRDNLRRRKNRKKQRANEIKT